MYIYTSENQLSFAAFLCSKDRVQFHKTGSFSTSFENMEYRIAQDERNCRV